MIILYGLKSLTHRKKNFLFLFYFIFIMASGKDITLKSGNATGGDNDGGLFILEAGKPSGANSGSNLVFKNWESSSAENATEHMRLTNSGNLGIGTETPLAKLHSEGSTQLVLNNTSGNVSLRFTTGNALQYIQVGQQYGVAGSAADLFIGNMTQDTSSSSRKIMFKADGNVGIGTDSPVEILTINGSITTNKNQFLGFNTYYDNTVGNEGWKAFEDGYTAVLKHENSLNRFEIRIGTGSTTANNSITWSDRLFFYKDAIKFEDLGKIQSYDSNHEIVFNRTSNQMIFHEYGDFIWKTWTDTERMRIKQNGSVGIGTNNPTTNLHVYGGGEHVFTIDGSSTWTYMRFYNHGTNYGYMGYYNSKLQFVSQNSVPLYLSSNTTYIEHGRQFNYISDDRLKFNEEYIENATTTLMKLKPQIYDKKVIDYDDNNDNPTESFIRESGLIAQEVYYDAPELRHLVKVGVNATDIETPPANYPSTDPTIDPDFSNWGEDYAGISYTNLIPYLIKMNQEQQTKIEELEARIQSLENPAP
jgi:hypothetical protein